MTAEGSAGRMDDRFGAPALLDALDPMIAAFPGDLGFYGKSLVTGEEVGHRADAVTPTASVVKVGIMAELYRQADAGEVDLTQRLTLSAADWVDGTGVLRDLAPGLAPTVADLCRLMITVSDNVATGMLVRLLGTDQIIRSFAAWGLRRTALVWNPAGNRGCDGAPRRYAVATARDLGRLMELLATDGFLSPGACAAMRTHLARQQQREQIPRFLPDAVSSDGDPTPRPVVVMNKPGVDVGVRVDAAIVTVRGGFVLATLTEGGSEEGPRLDRPGSLLNACIAEAVFNAWVRDAAA